MLSWRPECKQFIQGQHLGKTKREGSRIGREEPLDCAADQTSRKERAGETGLGRKFQTTWQILQN